MNIKTIIISIFSFLIFQTATSQEYTTCKALFSYEVNHEISPFTYNFIDLSTSPDKIVSWEWHFEGEAKSDLQHPTYQFFSHGIYTVSLQVTDNEGRISDYTEDIEVLPPVPKANCRAFFTYIKNTSAPVYTYDFIDNSIPANDTIISWKWDFGDGSPIVKTQHPTHQFTSKGTYNVSLTIITSSDCSSIHNTIVIVTDGSINCDANFTYNLDSNSSTPNTILFHDNSLFTDPITNWSWNFGDGDSSNYQDPIHIYDYPGIYNVTLRITTASCTSEILIPVKVGNPKYYNFWGRVYVGKQTADQCIAYLYQRHKNQYVLPIDTVELTSVNDTLGVYYFYQIAEGDYIVQVKLPETSQFFEDYAPSYYRNSILWSGSLNVKLTRDLSKQNIEMQQITRLFGSGYVSGKVDNSATGQVEGILVFLLNAAGEVINFTYTDKYGNYSFEDVNLSDYIITGDLTGFHSYPRTINLNNTNDTINVDFQIKGRKFTSIFREKTQTIKPKIKIYPNPITDNKVNISFASETSENFTYIITNAIGTLVKEGQIAKHIKNHSIDMSNIKAGIYLIYFYDKSNNLIKCRKIVK